MDKPSPWCACYVLTNTVQYPFSHYCHETSPSLTPNCLPSRTPWSFFFLQSYFLAPSLYCCRGLFRCNLPLLNFTRFHKVFPLRSLPLAVTIAIQFDATHKLHPMIQAITKHLKQYWSVCGYYWLIVTGYQLDFSRALWRFLVELHFLGSCTKQSQSSQVFTVGTEHQTLMSTKIWWVQKC